MSAGGLRAWSVAECAAREGERLVQLRGTAAGASCGAGTSPVESEGMASGSSWEISSVDEDDSCNPAGSSTSGSPSAAPASCAPASPLPPHSEFLAYVAEQRKQRALETSLELQASVLSMAQSRRWESEQHARIALNILLTEAAGRDLTTHSDRVSALDKQQKWYDFTRYLSDAVDIYGRSATDCKAQLANYHLFQRDVVPGEMAIDIYATTQKKRALIESLRHRGLLFVPCGESS